MRCASRSIELGGGGIDAGRSASFGLFDVAPNIYPTPRLALLADPGGMVIWTVVPTAVSDTLLPFNSADCSRSNLVICLVKGNSISPSIFRLIHGIVCPPDDVFLATFVIYENNHADTGTATMLHRGHGIGITPDFKQVRLCQFDTNLLCNDAHLFGRFDFVGHHVAEQNGKFVTTET
jgi:hypothetical protein